MGITPHCTNEVTNVINNINRPNNAYWASSYFNPMAMDMSTKGQCKVSEEEMVRRIRDLAYRDAAAGRDSQYAVKFHGVGTGTPEWRKLRADYISFASPDRAGIIQKKLSQLTGGAANLRLQSNSRFEAFAILFANGTKSARKIHDPDVGGNYIKFRDGLGNEVAEYCTLHGWTYSSTPEESARRSEFYDMWKQFLTEAQEELEQKELEKKQLNKELLDKAFFDARA